MSEDEVTEFIIGRLAELVVVLCREHVGDDAKSAKARSETRLILTMTGNWAAKNGRADLMPMLHGLAAKIIDPEPGQEAEPEPTFYNHAQAVPRIKYRW